MLIQSIHSNVCDSKNRIPNLSKRQLQVLYGLRDGKRYKEIAFDLGISENTISFHISALRQKLDCSTSRQILIRAEEYGLLI